MELKRGAANLIAQALEMVGDAGDNSRILQAVCQLAEQKYARGKTPDAQARSMDRWLTQIGIPTTGCIRNAIEVYRETYTVGPRGGRAIY